MDQRKNFISVNAKYYKSKEIDRIVKHNERISNIDYLLPKNLVKYKNSSIIFLADGSINKNPLGSDIFKKRFKELQQEKINLKSKRGSRTQKHENELIEMVIALSEEQALHYVENGFNLLDGVEYFGNDLREAHGFEPIFASLHLDEGHINKEGETKLNTHIHLTMFNFDFKKGIAPLRNMRKSDWSNMQDLAASSFEKANLNFQRGIKKTTRIKDHLERNQMHLKTEANRELNKLKSNIANEISYLNNIQNKTKEQRENLTKLQNEARRLNTIIKETKEVVNNLSEIVETHRENINKELADNTINTNNLIDKKLDEANQNLQDGFNQYGKDR